MWDVAVTSKKLRFCHILILVNLGNHYTLVIIFQKVHIAQLFLETVNNVFHVIVRLRLANTSVVVGFFMVKNSVVIVLFLLSEVLFDHNVCHPIENLKQLQMLQRKLNVRLVYAIYHSANRGLLSRLLSRSFRSCRLLLMFWALIGIQILFLVVSCYNSGLLELIDHHLQGFYKELADIGITLSQLFPLFLHDQVVHGVYNLSHSLQSTIKMILRT